MKTFLFWLASLTWGCIMTIVGLLVALGMLITLHKPHRFGHAIYFVSRRKGWGGVNLGPIFIVSKTSGESTKCHEYGHAWQNVCFGPGHVVISIWSCTRYWIRVWKEKHRPWENLPPYDSIWFEGQATEWGTKAYSKYNS